jgi:hypothetical protein
MRQIFPHPFRHAIIRTLVAEWPSPNDLPLDRAICSAEGKLGWVRLPSAASLEEPQNDQEKHGTDRGGVIDSEERYC